MLHTAPNQWISRPPICSLPHEGYNLALAHSSPNQWRQYLRGGIVHTLLICSNPDEAELLTFVLRRAGTTVTRASALGQGMRASGVERPDLIFVSMRGSTLTQQVLRVRADSEACLALISDTSDEDEVCAALGAGADLVIPRPYSARLLGAQLRALLRRGAGTTLSLLPSLTLGDLTLDPSTRTVQVQGQALRRLTQLEFRLLYVLMLHHDQTVPTEIIVERVWGYDAPGDTSPVRGLVRRLRAKVEPDPRRPRYIVSVPSVGYCLQLSEK